MKELKDKTGKAMGEEMLKVAQEGKVAEVSYMWPRPGGTDPVQKVTYVTKVADQVCGVGYYKSSLAGRRVVGHPGSASNLRHAARDQPESAVAATAANSCECPDAPPTQAVQHMTPVGSKCQRLSNRSATIASRLRLCFPGVCLFILATPRAVVAKLLSSSADTSGGNPFRLPRRSTISSF